MRPSTTRRRALAGACSAALAAVPGCGWIDRDERATVRRTVDPSSVGSLAIESRTGDLTVRRTDGDAIAVHGEKRAASEDAIAALSITERRDGDRLVLGTERGDGPDPVGWWRTPTLHLAVDVPAGVPVARTTADAGGIEVEDVSGPLTAAADAGDVYVANVEGAVEASTDAGDVTVRDVTGPIAARTGTGDVSADGAIASLATDTGGIAVTVRELAGDSAIQSDVGDVTLALARSLDATVTADVDAGDVDVHGDGLAADREAEDPTQFVLGDGSERLRIEVDAGDVSIATLG